MFLLHIVSRRPIHQGWKSNLVAHGESVSFKVVTNHVKALVCSRGGAKQVFPNCSVLHSSGGPVLPSPCSQPLLSQVQAQSQRESFLPSPHPWEFTPHPWEFTPLCVCPANITLVRRTSSVIPAVFCCCLWQQDEESRIRVLLMVYLCPVYTEEHEGLH